MKYLILSILLLFVGCGCATEGKKRTDAQYLTPDKFKMQFNINVDEKDDYDGHSTIDQVRFGFDWNL